MCGIRPVGGCTTSTSRKLTRSTRIEVAEVQDGVAGLRVARVAVAGVNTGNLKDLAIAADRHHLLAVNTEESMNLTRVPLAADGDRVAGSEEQLSDGYVRDRYPVVSPDGARIAVGSNRTGAEEVWVLDIASRRWQRIDMPAQAGGIVVQVCWTRDSQHLVAMRYLAEWHERILVHRTRRQLDRADSAAAARAPHHQWVCGVAGQRPHRLQPPGG